MSCACDQAILALEQLPQGPGGTCQGTCGQVPEVVARKGGMAAPCTYTKYLGEREILPIQKRRSDPSGLTSSRGGNR